MSTTTTTFPLDTIVKKIELKDNLLANEQLIIWEANARTTLAKEPPQVMKLFKKVIYFAFSDAEAACNAIVYRIMPGVSFDIKYKATCPRGNEGKIIASLYNPDEKFEVVLQKKIQTWVKEHIDQNKLPLILNNIQMVREFLQLKILTETGLSSIVDVRLQNVEYLKPYPVNSKKFPVRVPDYTNAINLSFVTELVLLEGCESLALQRYDSLSEQQSKLQAIIEKSIYHSVKLNLFYNELTKTVRPLLIAEVNNYLKSEGRQIFFLELNSDPIVSFEEERVDMEYNCSCKISEHSEQIKVKSIVSIKLEDLAAYKTAQRKYNITDIKSWFGENVVNVEVRDQLLNKKYEDILVEMDTIKKTLNNNIKVQAATYGYNLTQYIFEPEIKKLDLNRESFEVLLDGRKFLSSDSRVSVTLFLKVNGNITNLKNIEDRRLLLPNVIIEQEIQNEIVKTVEEVLHKIDPERFFMRFKGSNEDDAVDKVIIDKITDILISKFAVDGSSLKFIINPMENEVSQKVADLCIESQEIVVSLIPSLNSPYTERIDFTILFRIMGVLPTGWYAFQMNLKKDAGTEINEIKRFLGMRAHESLVSCKYEELMSQEHTFKNAIKEKVLKRVFDSVSKQLGLFIEFLDCQRGSTITEIQANQSLENKVQKEEENNRLLIEKQLTSHNKMVDELLAKRDDLRKKGLEKEAKEVEARLNELQEDYKNYIDNQGVDIRKISGIKLTENNSNTSLLEALGNNPKLIENAGNN